MTSADLSYDVQIWNGEVREGAAVERIDQALRPSPREPRNRNAGT